MRRARLLLCLGGLVAASALVGLLWEAVAAVVEPSYTEVERRRTPLIEGFESYAGAADLKAGQLERMPWAVYTESSQPRTDRRPTFDFLIVSVPSFTHLGHRGELSLSFFNDRLMTTVFYPEDPQGYREALARSGLELDESGEGSVRPYTSVWAGTDPQRKSYVA